MLYLPLIIKMIIISFHSLFCFFFALHTFLVIVVQGAYDNQRAHEKKTMLFDKLFYFDDDDDAFIPFFVFNTHSASFPFTFVHFFRFSAIAAKRYNKFSKKTYNLLHNLSMVRVCFARSIHNR